MATAKRIICEEETKVEIEKNKATRMEDRRLGDLPEALQVRILAFLDTKQAVKASVLSKTWVSLWTRTPGLEFNDLRIRMFDDFVKTVLCRRDHLAKLDSLKFNVSTCTTKTLKSVFEYAFSHGVKQLEASIEILSDDGDSWPVSQCDSLTSLKLQNVCVRISCPFLGAGSIYFKNLTVLYLKGASITDVEPFSGFAVLKTLTLNNCYFCKTLRVHGLQLSHLTISNCSGIKCCKLTTPRLRFLEYRGFDLPKPDQGLPVLENMEIDCYDFYHLGRFEEQWEKQRINELLLLFSTLGNLKWLKISLGILAFLLKFPEELAIRSSPFRELKGLKFDIMDDHRAYLFENFPLKLEVIECMMSNLLKNSPDAEFTTTSPKLDDGDGLEYDNFCDDRV